MNCTLQAFSLNFPLHDVLHLRIILCSLANYLVSYGTLWMASLECLVPGTRWKHIDEKNVRPFPDYSFKNRCECLKYPVLLVITRYNVPCLRHVMMMQILKRILTVFTSEPRVRSYNLRVPITYGRYCPYRRKKIHSWSERKLNPCERPYRPSHKKKPNT